MERYARRRYGPATPPSAGAAWQLLLESVYNSTDLHNDHKCAHHSVTQSVHTRMIPQTRFVGCIIPHGAHSPDMATAHGEDRLKKRCVASRSCDVPTSRPALERAEGVPWGLIPQLWYDDSKVGLRLSARLPPNQAVLAERNICLKPRPCPGILFHCMMDPSKSAARSALSCQRLNFSLLTLVL